METAAEARRKTVVDLAANRSASPRLRDDRVTTLTDHTVSKLRFQWRRRFFPLIVDRPCPPCLSPCPRGQAAGLLATAVVLSSTSPALAALFLPLGWVYAKLQRYYRSSSRELRRLDSTSRWAHLL